MSPIPNIKILQILAIRNHNWDNVYNGLYNQIKLLNNGDANERILFHGTKMEGAEGVLAGNFENSYYAQGRWGRGAYFADDPNKSH